MQQHDDRRSLMTRVRRRLTYANVVATLALVFALGGTAAAAVMITSNSQVAQNTISGHAAPAGKHANIISGSINAGDLNTSVKTSLTDQCPSGMQLAPGGLCIETKDRVGNFLTALTTCQNLGRRLPSVAELVELFNASSAPTSIDWTSDAYFAGDTAEAMAASQNSSRQLDFQGTPWTAGLFFRCVSTPID
jgi:predicted acyltransferase (DUF342 family)